MSDAFKSLFNVDGIIHGYVGPDPFAGPIATFYGWHENNGPATGVAMKIVSIDVEGTIAAARVELDNWTGHRFTDMFTLLKSGSEWKIISKVFHLHG
ncbi:MAG TPA: nuclear transport factor 2 family protein [Phycisphaerales bacterium]|nr:nuclear transport factor 2 family protein [Phycisphaerales bacterium]HRQ76399.1 nuclear transport factor 2 family protein [Phycisphaerales bacterium]